MGTDHGARGQGSPHADQYVYVPFSSSKGHNHCVMRIQHNFVIQLPGMGWPNDEARLAMGIMYDHLRVREGVGLESRYNDEPADGACVVPRMIFASKAKLKAGYTWGVFLRQVNCPVSHLIGSKGSTFITVSKMGMHGRLDHEKDA